MTSLLLRLDLIGAAGLFEVGALCGGRRIPVGSGNPLSRLSFPLRSGGKTMNSIIYIVGLVVVIGAVLAFLGLR